MRWCAAALLAVGLALIGCASKQSASLHVSPSLESLVPADTVVVLGVNFAALRNSSIYQKLITRLPLPQLDAFTQQTGLDPRKDFSELLLCSDDKNGLLLVRGNFHVSDLEARLKSKGEAQTEYKGRPIFGDQPVAITFVNDSVAAAGPPVQIRRLIDQRGGSGSGLPAGLRDLLRTLPASDQIYAALTGGIGNLNLPLPREGDLASIMQSLRSVDTATVGMNLSNGIDAVAVVNCSTQRDAKFIHDMLRGLIGLGRLRAPDNQPDLLKLYDSVQVTEQQAQTKVTANVPQQLADKFIDLWLK